MRMVLERAMGRASSTLSPGHHHFASHTKELEEEVSNREQHVLSLYRSIFEQCISRSSSEHSSVVTSPAHTKNGSRKHPSIISSAFCSSKKFPLHTLHALTSVNESGKRDLLQYKTRHASLLTGKANIHFEKTCTENKKLRFFMVCCLYSCLIKPWVLRASFVRNPSTLKDGGLSWERELFNVHKKPGLEDFEFDSQLDHPILGDNAGNSAGSNMKSSFIAMGSTPAQVDRAIEEAGEGNVDLILETLITYSCFHGCTHVPLKVCEARDPKGLYKLAQAGFAGIDDPHINSENASHLADNTTDGGPCGSPRDLAKTIISFLEENKYLQA